MFWQDCRLLRVLCLLALPGLALAQTQYPGTRKGVSQLVGQAVGE